MGNVRQGIMAYRACIYPYTQMVVCLCEKDKINSMKSWCRHCADSVHSGSWIRIWITQCGKCFEFWFVLPNGIKPVRLSVKICVRPTQKLDLFSLTSVTCYIVRQKKTWCLPNSWKHMCIAAVDSIWHYPCPHNSSKPCWALIQIGTGIKETQVAVMMSLEKCRNFLYEWHTFLVFHHMLWWRLSMHGVIFCLTDVTKIQRSILWT